MRAFISGLHLNQGVASDPLHGFGEVSVNHFTLFSGVMDALALGVRLKRRRKVKFRPYVFHLWFPFWMTGYSKPTEVGLVDRFRGLSSPSNRDK